MAVSPNMGMDIPDVGSTTGPIYATKLNTALLTVVDGHDHTPGFGVKVPSAGININSDLSFGGFNATSLQAAAFSNQSADPSGNWRVYFKGGELYATDGSGNHVQMTSGGNVNVGSVGAITGMGGTSATVSYNNATKTFTFNQAATQTALMKVGDVAITDSTVTSGAAVTVKAPAALASGYTVTFPGTLPGSTLPVQMSSAGVLSTPATLPANVVVTSSITDANVTRPKLASVGEQTATIATGSLTSGTLADITGATVSLTTVGRPVMLVVGGSTNDTFSNGVGLTTSAAGVGQVAMAVLLDGVVQSQAAVGYVATAGGLSVLAIPLQSAIFATSAGAHTIKLQYKITGTGTPSVVFNNMKMTVYEL